MYPPPPLDIIQRLLRIDIETVCHGRCVVHLGFENGNGLSFSAPFRFADRKVLADSPIFDFPLSESNLLRALGCHVTALECEPDGTLALRFSNNDVLVVYANSPAYEAYTLKIDGKEYVV